MLVVALSKPWRFFDLRPFDKITDIAYTPFVLVTALVILAAFALSVAHQLVADSIIAKAEGKLTILKKVAKFFREYKAEIHKIVWPNLKSVSKNTLIVLAMCAIFGVFVWLLDLGLGALIGLIS
ncbi:MAG: preprotein translocase subunit SecE [Clostridia bacterium]|nr:preprotein translocase subunit SecE [Clostridia bacterium]